MAIYYFHMDVKSRSQGHSVESVGAYMTGSQMTDALTNEKYDHRTKDDVDDVFVLAPAWGAAHFKQPETLCQEISRREKRKDSQLCRYAVIGLPIELQFKENRKLIKEFCQQAFVRRGMVVLVAIHGIGSGNPHVHIIISMRTFDTVSGRFGLKKREWNSPELLINQRKEWEVVCNQFLAQAGIPERISSETYEKQGIEKPKQKHMGSYVHKLLKEKGVIIERSAQYAIDAETINLANINKEIAMVESEMIALRLDSGERIADVILKPISDFARESNGPAQIPQLKPVAIPEVAIQNRSDVYSDPIFDLSRVYGRRSWPKITRSPSKYMHDFDLEMNLNPIVPITRVGNPSIQYQHQMTIKDRIQQYINNHWDLREILPDSMIAELGLQDVVEEILEIRGENFKDLGFSFWDQPDDDFAETCESNHVIDGDGQRRLSRDYHDPYRDYVPIDEFEPQPPSPRNSGPSMGL